VIEYWEKMDKNKLKYRNLIEEYTRICENICQSLEKKSLEKYGVPIAKLEDINSFINENIEAIKKLQLFQREIKYQQSKLA
jgi:hypothetical protein